MLKVVYLEIRIGLYMKLLLYLFHPLHLLLDIRAFLIISFHCYRRGFGKMTFLHLFTSDEVCSKDYSIFCVQGCQTPKISILAQIFQNKMELLC